MRTVPMMNAATIMSLLAVLASGQQNQTFEVASVKPAALGRNGFRGGCHGIDSKYTPTQLESAPPLGRCVITDARLSHLIYIAFGLRSMEQIKGDPDGAAAGATDRFNVDARAEDPAATTESQLLRMLQLLLVERFQLKFHRETKDMAGFALVVAKNGPKLEKAKDEEETHLAGSLKPRRGEPVSVLARGYSMAKLADLLSQLGTGQVVDKTGLTGNYNFKLTWDEASGPTLFTALQEQLGLRFESQKVQVSFVVVDSAQKLTNN